MRQKLFFLAGSVSDILLDFAISGNKREVGIH
jgi:hypothetical protein